MLETTAQAPTFLFFFLLTNSLWPRLFTSHSHSKQINHCSHTSKNIQLTKLACFFECGRIPDYHKNTMQPYEESRTNSTQIGRSQDLNLEHLRHTAVHCIHLSVMQCSTLPLYIYIYTVYLSI